MTRLIFKYDIYIRQLLYLFTIWKLEVVSVGKQIGKGPIYRISCSGYCDLSYPVFCRLDKCVVQMYVDFQIRGLTGPIISDYEEP